MDSPSHTPNSPFTATSPPGGTPINLSKKRPSLGPPSGSGLNPKRRKPSSTLGQPSALRQTSFPPEGAPSFSPHPIGTPRYSRSPSVDTGSLLGGATPSLLSTTTAGRKRGRKSKGAAAAGGGDEADSTSARGTGTTGRGRGRPPKAAAQDADADDDDEDEDDLLDGFLEDRARDKAAEQADNNKKDLFLASLVKNEGTEGRYAVYRYANLDAAPVRKLVNQTLSQSVGKAVITVVRGYTKMFLAELIDIALDVQKEWLAAGVVRPVVVPEDTAGPVMEAVGDEEGFVDRTAWEHRGPLTPDMLREALRRYKKSAVGGAAGFIGLSGEGRENVGGRLGGRKLFR